MVIVADDEQIEVARSAGDNRYLLSLVVKHGCTWEREPVRVPTGMIGPERGPDTVVVADDKKVKVAGGAGYGSDALMLAIEYCLSGELKEI